MAEKPRLVRHKQCSPSCIKDEVDLVKKAGVGEVKELASGGVFAANCSPFHVPILTGFTKLGSDYVAPCGKEFSWKEEVMDKLKKYLSVTGSKLSTEQFVFSSDISSGLIQVDLKGVICSDVSNGQEAFPIPVVNTVNDDKIDLNFVYKRNRIALEGIDLNTEHKSCCDCEGDCDKSGKCSCRQLSADDFDENDVIRDTHEFRGYDHRRMPFLIITGNFECNSGCKCGPKCSNRLVQNDITSKLEVFMTPNRGWGLRVLHDLPRGSFVCTYSGELMAARQSEEIGPIRGDEYFTQLNLIDVVQDKEGYESEANLSDNESIKLERSPATSDFSDDSNLSSNESDSSTPKKYWKRQLSPTSQATSSNPKKVCTEPPTEPIKPIKLRDYFEKHTDGEAYILDAKKFGNVGRFLNHSCSENCILRSVLVDTHDLRFPWSAFFTIDNVKAGTELTWNYLYKKGHENFVCECGSANCRSLVTSESDISK